MLKELWVKVVVGILATLILTVVGGRIVELNPQRGDPTWQKTDDEVLSLGDDEVEDAIEKLTSDKVPDARREAVRRQAVRTLRPFWFRDVALKALEDAWDDDQPPRVRTDSEDAVKAMRSRRAEELRHILSGRDR